MPKTYCPECDAIITIENPREGQMIKCGECGTELEIIETNPSFEVDYPFDDDEDWDYDYDLEDEEEEEDYDL